jgi:hypothetical protein
VFLGNRAEKTEIESDRLSEVHALALELAEGCLRQYFDRMLPISKFEFRKRASVRSKYLSGSYCSVSTRR